MPRFRNLAGQRFGRLRVTAFEGRIARPGDSQHRSYWRCRCECGKDVVVSGPSLTRGLTRSCGCFRNEVTNARNRAAAKHGGSKTALFQVWGTMIGRCENPGATGYKLYGGRGIRVCARWRKDFAAFRDDMGPRPTPQHTLDRIDNDGNYTPSNCRWATWATQTRNRRSTVLLSFAGKTQCVTDWAKELGVPRMRLYDRLRNGWSVERTLTEQRHD